MAAHQHTAQNLSDNLSRDPHPAWLAAFRAEEKRINETPEEASDEGPRDAEISANYDLIKRIVQTPANTLHGVAAQLETALEIMEEWQAPDAEDAVGNALDALLRLPEHSSTARCAVNPSLAELNRRWQANESRWDSPAVHARNSFVENDPGNLICNECAEEHDRIVRDLERAPIASPADALAAARLALLAVDNLLGENRLNPEDDPYEPRAIRCLDAALRWLEGNRPTLASRPALVTDEAVAAALAAEHEHRHDGAEARMRAALMAAFGTGEGSPPADAEFMAAQRFEPSQIPEMTAARWRERAAEEYRVMSFTRILMAKNDGDLTAAVAKDPDMFIVCDEGLNDLIERAEAQAEIFTTMRTRLLVALSRWELENPEAAAAV